MKHPDYLFKTQPEQVLINPDNLLILLQHLRCAAFELPFKLGDKFGSVLIEHVHELLEFLKQEGVLYMSDEKYYWLSDNYPANDISLRSTSTQTIILQVLHNNRWNTIGEVDQVSAHWMVHPHAIYLHGGNTYIVDDLDLNRNLAKLRPIEVDYYTEPRNQVDIELLNIFKSAKTRGGSKSYGEILVTSKLVGFRKIKWFTNEILSEDSIVMPPTQLRTTAFWLSLNNKIINNLRQMGEWNNTPNIYGSDWVKLRNIVRSRDKYICQICGASEIGTAHHVHHIIPFRSFSQIEKANKLENLTTLCPLCRQKAELIVRMKSGLAGLKYILHHIAPLFIMCDINDLGSLMDPVSPL